jgi:hypothetical protein
METAIDVLGFIGFVIALGLFVYGVHCGLTTITEHLEREVKK